MIHKKIQLIELSPEEFKNEIISAVKQELIHLTEELKPKKVITWITRQETSEKLGVSLVTLHNWNLSGKLKAHKIGGAVRYKLSDIEETLSSN